MKLDPTPIGSDDHYRLKIQAAVQAAVNFMVLCILIILGYWSIGVLNRVKILESRSEKLTYLLELQAGVISDLTTLHKKKMTVDQLRGKLGNKD